MSDCRDIVELIELLNEVSKELEVEGYDGPLETPTKEELESEKRLIELLAEVSKELDDERKLEKEARKKKKVPCPTPKYAAKIIPDERKIKNDENKKEMQIPSEKSKKALLEMTILEKSEAADDNALMISDFVFDGKIRKLQISRLTPFKIAKIFRIAESTLILTDNEGLCYIPEGDTFDQSLYPCKVYTVDGMQLSETPAEEISENRRAVKKQNVALQGIKESQQLDFVQNIILNCKKINENANMLYNGPQAVIVIQALAILSVSAPDPSLNVVTLNSRHRIRLADSNSFRASLIHVAKKMCSAFNQADQAMKLFRVTLVALPDYFDATLEVVGQDDNGKAKKILARTSYQIAKATETCKRMAMKAKNTFEDIIEDIDALSVAATLSKTSNGRQKVEFKKLQKEMAIWQTECKIAEERLKQEKEKADTKVKEALKEYQKQMNKPADLEKLYLTTLNHGVINKVKNVDTMLYQSGNGATNAIKPKNSIKCSNDMKYVVEIELIKCLKKYTNALSKPTELHDYIIRDYIATLKHFQKYSAATKEGFKVFKEAKKFRYFLVKHQSEFKNVNKNPVLVKELTELKGSVSNLLSTISIARKQIKTGNFVSNCLREKLIKADSERVNSAQHRLTAAEAKAETRRRNGIYENKKELTDILCNLNSVDTTTPDLTEIIKYLRSGVEHLGKVKKNWEHLTKFFDHIHIIVDENLTTNIPIFLDEAKDHVSRKLMLQSAFKATAYCIRISNQASIYCDVSEKFIMPVISCIREQLSMEPHQAKQKQREIDITKMGDEVREFVESKQVKFYTQFDKQMSKHACNMAKAVKTGNTEATKAFKK